MGTRLRQMRGALAFALGVTALAVPAAQDAAATGAIAGVVVTTDSTPAPVRRAIVTITGDLPSTRATVTDEAGRFAFERLPAGRFTVTARKASFLTNAYGAKRPGRPGTPVSILRGERMSNLTLPLPRGAVLSGVVRDERQMPVSGTAVIAALADNSSTSAVAQRQTTYTDDRGAYRLYGLPPGAYVICATASTTPGIFGNGIFASIFDTPSTSDIDAMLQALRQRTTARGTATPAPATTVAFAAAPMFYPGTPRPADATAITVGVGEERAGLDFTVVPVRSAVVDGSVTGLPAGQQVGVLMQSSGRVIAALPSLQPTISATPSPATFKFASVEPGDYVLMARTMPAQGITTFSVSESSTSVTRPAPGMETSSATPAVPVFWGTTRVTISGDDMSGVPIVLQPAMRLSGRVMFDGGSATASLPTSARFTLTPTNDNGGTPLRFYSMLSNPQNGSASGRNADATSITTSDAGGGFAFVDLLPLTYTLAGTVSGGTADWWLRSAIVRDRDILDLPLTVTAAEDITGAMFTFTNRHSELTGALHTSTNQPAAGFAVVVVPEDRALWLHGARRIRWTRPGTDGHFSFRDLPAGSYRLAALTDVEASDLDDASLLSQIVAGGVSVTMTDGARTVQDVQLSER